MLRQLSRLALETVDLQQGRPEGPEQADRDDAGGGEDHPARNAAALAQSSPVVRRSPQAHGRVTSVVAASKVRRISETKARCPPGTFPLCIRSCGRGFLLGPRPGPRGDTPWYLAPADVREGFRSGEGG